MDREIIRKEDLLKLEIRGIESELRNRLDERFHELIHEVDKINKKLENHILNTRISLENMDITIS